MERKLPVYTLEGVDFYVDVKKAELIEVQTPFINRININELEDAGTHYIIHWNKDDKNQDTYDAYIRRNAGKINTINSLSERASLAKFNEQQQQNHVKIPPLKELDPQGMAETYKTSITALADKTDWEIMVDQRLYGMRVNSGMLPQVLIDNHTFYVDYRMNELRPHDDFLHTIRFQEMFHYDIGGAAPGSVRVPYQPSTHSLNPIDLGTVTSIPKGIVIVDIPIPSLLDPVGVARDQRLDINAYLRSHPLVDTTVVNIVPWKDTVIPSFIEKNKKQKKVKKAKGIK